MNIKNLGLVLCLCLAQTANSQNPDWYSLYNYVFPVSDGLHRVIKEGKYGFADAKGELVIPCKYEFVSNFNFNCAFFWEDGKYGCINKKQKTRFPAQFDDYHQYQMIDCNIVYINGLSGLINNKGKILLPAQYSFLRGVWGSPLRFISQKNGAYALHNQKGKTIIDLGVDTYHSASRGGFIEMETAEGQAIWNLKGRAVIPPIYENINSIGDGCFVAKKQGRYGIINSKNKIILAFEYNYIEGYMQEGLIAVQKNTLWGFSNTKGELVIPYQWEKVSAFQEGEALVQSKQECHFINTKGEILSSLPFLEMRKLYDKPLHYSVNKNGKYGVADKMGNLLIPAIYDEHLRTIGLDQSYLEVQYEGKKGIIDSSGKTILDAIYTDIEDMEEEDVVWVKREGKWAIQDLRGKVYCPPTFTNAYIFYNGRYISAEIGDKYGLVDVLGETIIDFMYDHPLRFSEGLAAVKKEDKWGYINLKNELVIPFLFEQAAPFVWGKALVVKDSLSGYINQQGEWLIPAVYTTITSAGRNSFYAKKGEKYGMIDHAGQVLLPFEYDGISSVEGGTKIYYLQKGDSFGLVSNRGEIIVPVEYQQLECNRYGFLAQKNELWGLIDENNQIFIPIEYQALKPNLIGYEHMAIEEYIYTSFLVKKDNRWGCIDFKNQVIFDVKYDEIRELDDSLLLVRIGALEGCINRDGASILPIEYQNIWHINSSHFLVLSASGYGLFDVQGRQLLPCEHDNYRSFEREGFFWLKKSDKWGVVSLANTLLIDFQYDDIKDFRNGFSAVKKGNFWGYINEKGELIIPCMYDTADYFDSQQQAKVSQNAEEFIIDGNGKRIFVENRH